MATQLSKRLSELFLERAAAHRFDGTDAAGVLGAAEGFDIDGVVALADDDTVVAGFDAVVVCDSVAAALAVFGAVVADNSVAAEPRGVGSAVVALADSVAAVCGIAAAGCAAVFGTVVAGTVAAGNTGAVVVDADGNPFLRQREKYRLS